MVDLTALRMPSRAVRCESEIFLLVIFFREKLKEKRNPWVSVLRRIEKKPRRRV